MSHHNSTDHDIIALEREARKMTRLLLSLCEKRLGEDKGELTQEHIALASSALVLRKSIDAFLAVEKLCYPHEKEE